MKLTTLCYLLKEDEVLMLHRIKKDVDENKGKWIGLGGKLESKESPKECVIREVYEEAGLKLNSVDYRGTLTFISDKWDDEIIFMYTSDNFSGELQECNEGILKWVKKEDVLDLNLWEGDRVYIKRLIDTKEVFELKLHYDVDDNLIEIIQ